MNWGDDNIFISYHGFEFHLSLRACNNRITPTYTDFQVISLEIYYAYITIWTLNNVKLLIRMIKWSSATIHKSRSFGLKEF